jgi:L-iditol 2-dehydrogenase
MSMMKALVLTGYNHFEWQDTAMPEAGENEVLVQIKACAVCGSDVHGMDGSTGRRVPPVIMGHEAAGVIAVCGRNVHGWKAGDRVTFDSTVYCGVCGECAAGRVNLCGNRRVLGVSCAEYRMNGAFAEYISVPHRILYALPDAVDYTQAAMVEPLSVAYHAVTRTPASARGVTVVIGVGTIGMLIVQVLRALGAKTIIAADIAPEKLAFALAHGADYAVDCAGADAEDKILALTERGGGADLCFDAAGLPSTFSLGLRAVKKGGSMVLVGNIAQTADFPLQWAVTREITLYGSCASAGEYPACLDLIASGQVDTRAMISKAVPMSEGDAWIHRVYAGEKGLSKVVLIP